MADQSILLKLENYPNPFIASTTIEFFLSQKDEIVINIYNVLGQKVRTLVHQNYFTGVHSVIWDGKDDQGNYLSKGIYMYRLFGKNISITHKAFLLK